MFDEQQGLIIGCILKQPITEPLMPSPAAGLHTRPHIYFESKQPKRENIERDFLDLDTMWSPWHHCAVLLPATGHHYLTSPLHHHPRPLQCHAAIKYSSSGYQVKRASSLSLHNSLISTHQMLSSEPVSVREKQNSHTNSQRCFGQIASERCDVSQMVSADPHQIGLTGRVPKQSHTQANEIQRSRRDQEEILHTVKHCAHRVYTELESHPYSLAADRQLTTPNATQVKFVHTFYHVD